MKLHVGFDDQNIGHYCIRDGKIDCVSDSDGGRENLHQRLDTHMRHMVEYHGHDGNSLTPESVLKWIAGHAGSGRNWVSFEE